MWSLFGSIPVIIGYSVFLSITYKRIASFTIDHRALQGNKVVLPNRGNITFENVDVAPGLGKIYCRREIDARHISVGIGSHLIVRSVCCKDITANLHYGGHESPSDRDPNVGDFTFRWNTY